MGGVHLPQSFEGEIAKRHEYGKRNIILGTHFIKLGRIKAWVRWKLESDIKQLSDFEFNYLEWKSSNQCFIDPWSKSRNKTIWKPATEKSLLSKRFMAQIHEHLDMQLSKQI